MPYATLKEEVYAKCTQAQIESRDLDLIAEIVSEGRTKANGREVGNGTIVEILGFTAGNALLDVLYNSVQFRYAKPLLEQGRLIISSDMVVSCLADLVAASVITSDNRDKLVAAGRVADPVTAFEISVAVYNSDGSLK